MDQVIAKLVASTLAIGALVGSQFIADSVAKQTLTGLAGTLIGWAWLKSPGQGSAKPKAPSVMPLGVLALIVCVLDVAGCAAAQQVTCPLVKLASDVCPLVMVQLHDGGVEGIPRTEVERLATTQRAARLAAERDGGTR